MSSEESRTPRYLLKARGSAFFLIMTEELNSLPFVVVGVQFLGFPLVVILIQTFVQIQI
jgi:hypothetical protein